jgi:hypothetical protein
MLATVGPIIVSGTGMMIYMTWYLSKAIEGVRQAALMASANLGERVAKVEARLDAQQGILDRLLPGKT